MKRSFTCFLFKITGLLAILTGMVDSSYAQTGPAVLQPKINNYTSFSVHNSSAETTDTTRGKHALTMDALNASATEVIEKRTANLKYYIDKSNPAKFYQLYAYGGNLNYRKNGQWLTIDSRLKPIRNGFFEAADQEEPVGFNIESKTAFIQTLAGKVNFNNWTLAGQKSGTLTVLAHANWANYTAGDDGLLIHNIFPGIDAEMTVRRGAIETSFIIRSNQYPAMDSLIFKDRFETGSDGGKLVYDNPENHHKAAFYINNTECLNIDRLIAYPQKNSAQNYQYLDYAIRNNELSFSISASYIKTHLSASGNVIIVFRIR